jgi:hypothetical protein
MEKNKAGRTRQGLRVERGETPNGYLYKGKTFTAPAKPKTEPPKRTRKKAAPKEAAKAKKAEPAPKEKDEDLSTCPVCGTEVSLKGDEQVEYDGEMHTAANLFDALKEGYYGKF